VFDVFESAECQGGSSVVAEKQPVQHSLDGGVLIVDKEVECSMLDGPFAAKRVALDVTFDVIGVVIRIGHEPVHTVHGNSEMEHDRVSALFPLTSTFVIVELTESDVPFHFLRKAEFGLYGVHIGGKFSVYQLQRDAISPAPLSRALHAEIDSFRHAVLTEV